MIMQEDAEKRPGGAHEGSLCADLRCARCACPFPLPCKRAPKACTEPAAPPVMAAGALVSS
jgi:hypothetical protein